MSPHTDPRWVYRPMIDLIGRAEGTDPVPGNRSTARGYNETLGYGAYTGGPVDLVSMTLDEVDALQTRMLRHPDNHFNSSAVGRLQIVRTTLRSIRSKLALSGNALFDEVMQDKLTCFLLGRRGIDEWLRNRISTNQLINNLAMEWASFPTTDNTGHYSGQSSRINVSDVRAVLAEVKQRHDNKSAVVDSPVTLDPPIVPPTPSGTPGAANPVLGGEPTLDLIIRLSERPAAELDRVAQALGMARAMQNGWAIQEPQLTVSLSPLATNKDTLTMGSSKSFLKSKTIWGLLVTGLSLYSPAIGGVLNAFGIAGADVDPETLASIKGGIEQLMAAVGLLFAAYGRIVAKTDIKLLSSETP